MTLGFGKWTLRRAYCLHGCYIMVWGVFFSLILKRPLLAAVLSVAMSSIIGPILIAMISVFGDIANRDPKWQ